MNIKLLVFDFDGTLGDTRRNIVMTLQQTMQEKGLAIADEERCAATIGLTLEDCFRVLFPGMSAAEADECAGVYRRIFEVNRRKLSPQLFPHVRETFDCLRDAGMTIAIASSRHSASLRDFLSDMGIEEYVAYVVGADNVSHPKPAPEPVVMILEALGVPASETIVVGDMPVDVMMGRNAGMLTCGVSYGNASREQLEASGADYVIDDMSALLDIVGLK
ncbi:MAG: HAD-IA family hydrolase [Prevotella sp.]|nr:HAD-IA family hydrolase [Prevotella sp.]